MQENEQKKSRAPLQLPLMGEIFIVLTIKASFRTQRDSILNTESTKKTKHFRKAQQATQVSSLWSEGLRQISQSYQSSTNKKINLWKKIAQIGNYCQLKSCLQLAIKEFVKFTLITNYASAISINQINPLPFFSSSSRYLPVFKNWTARSNCVSRPSSSRSVSRSTSISGVTPTPSRNFPS